MTDDPPPKPLPARRMRFEMARGDGDSRTLVHLISSFIQRIDALRREAYFGDMEQAIVAGMVAIGAIDHQFRKPDFRDAYGDIRTVVGVEGQRGVNALSIAAATGIPRETVRRKLKQLVAKGAIMEKERGRFISMPGFVQQPENVAAVEQAVRGFLQLMNDSVSLGVVIPVEAKE
jgi:hypothetical protein